MSDPNTEQPAVPDSYVNFDTYARVYDATRGLPPEIQLSIAARMRDAARWQSGDIFLDAGIGTGRFAVPLGQLGVPVIGLDISANMLAQMLANLELAQSETEAELPVRAIRADLRRFPVAGGAFKAVVIVHILHLIADWKLVLAEAQRSLTPDGVLLLGKQGGNSSPVRRFHHQLATERGLLATPLGAHGQEVRDYLEAQGARVETVDTSDITWTTQRPVSLTLEMLRRRVWSSLRAIPDADNAALMAETEAWARRYYGTLDSIEEDEGAVTLTAVRWTCS
jgi:ubiquinone/menaquinone biosynthesis C-methylase UbiE